MSTKPIAYLDYNATAPIRPSVVDAVMQALSQGGNPSSVHRLGRAARKVIEDAREAVAALVNVKPEQVVFTSGGTEANQAALRGLGAGVILASAIEHSTVLQAAAHIQQVSVTRKGIIDLEALETDLKALQVNAGLILIALQLANNETGVIQPVARAVEIAHAYGARVHCDAVQAAGKIEIDMAALGVDTLALSAHKIGGPQGVGALVLREGLPFAPLLTGGQERGRRGGTENVAGIAGFGVAAKAAKAELSEMATVQAKRDALQQRLMALAPDAQVFGGEVERLPNTLCIAMPHVKAETQVMAFDLAGVAISAGAACSSGKVRASHVLIAMGAGEALAMNAVRFSIGLGNSDDDFVRAEVAWNDLYRRTRMQADLSSAA